MVVLPGPERGVKDAWRSLELCESKWARYPPSLLVTRSASHCAVLSHDAFLVTFPAAAEGRSVVPDSRCFQFHRSHSLLEAPLLFVDRGNVVVPVVVLLFPCLDPVLFRATGVAV